MEQLSFSIDPLTHVITIETGYLSLVQSNPTTIYELELNDFRLDLKNWEDSEEGIHKQKTHDHNTEVELAGVTYARIINILPPYTVTFEDDQYAVNLVGANTNLGDRVNVNQVSVRVNNSAGLITSKGIQRLEYNGEVALDYESGSVGYTHHPYGTRYKPLKYWSPDGVILANSRGFDKIYIQGNYTFQSGESIDGYYIHARSPRNTLITLEEGLSTDLAEFHNVSITGTLDGDTDLYMSNIIGLDYINGSIRNCVFYGNIQLAGSNTPTFINCVDGQANGVIPTIDMGGSGRNCILAGYRGDIKFTNLTGNQFVSVQMDGGRVWLDETVTSGYFFIDGECTVEGVVNSGVNLVCDGILNKECIAQEVWETDVSGYDLLTGTMGYYVTQGGGFTPEEKQLLFGLMQYNCEIIPQAWSPNREMTSGTMIFYDGNPESGVELGRMGISGYYDDELKLTKYRTWEQ